MAGAFAQRSGTVLVWITETLDIMMAQQVVRAMSGSMGLDHESSFSAMVDVSEKGRVLLSGGSGGGLLVLRAGCERGRRELSVDAIDMERPAEAKPRRHARGAAA